LDFHNPIRNFLKAPFPLWETGLSSLLVAEKWRELQKKQISGPTDYSIEKCLLKQSIKQVDIVHIAGNHITIALPTVALIEFHQEHGLVPLLRNEATSKGTIHKIVHALNNLGLVEPVNLFLNDIVQNIQLIKTEDEKTDTSYSHPAIPFSIFISVCKDKTLKSNLRVAESILHEAMHLKLTLIEDHVPLVKAFDGNLYFSPWRDEKRPAKGVLHGLFVFKALLEYFKAISTRAEVQSERNYIESRIGQITADIFSLCDFKSCADLTKDGAILTANLLPLN
jgi:hypothetical protein